MRSLGIHKFSVVSIWTFFNFGSFYNFRTFLRAFGLTEYLWSRYQPSCIQRISSHFVFELVVAAKAPAPLQCDWSQSWAATKLPISEYTVTMQNLLKPRMVSVTNLLKGQSVDSNSSHVRIDINQIFIQRYTELFVFLLLSLVFEIIVTAVNDVKKFLCFFNFSNFSCQYREWYH